MPAKRIRVFAGPNGSGKTTIVNDLRLKYSYGVYVNADDIEAELKSKGNFFFDKYKLNVEEKNLQDFFRLSSFSPIKRNESDLWKKLSVQNNSLIVSTLIDSYLAADIAEFIRLELLENNFSFTYETVMSHKGKIDFLQKAIDKHYKVYLYFIATEDPEININRVNVRVAQSGHAVPPDVIRSRYYRSLENLKNAVMKTNRAFIFDNSGSAAVLIAEITDGLDVNIIETSRVPNWLVKYLINP